MFPVEDYTYCISCGEKLEECPKCPHCGEEINPEIMSFCPSCGRPLR